MTQPDTLIQALDSFEPRSSDATATGAQAFARLLELAEHRNSGQIARVVQFIAATYNGQAFAFDLFDLRALDIEISDDMLRCLDALRWARADLYTLVPAGDARVRSVIDRWACNGRTTADRPPVRMPAPFDFPTPRRPDPRAGVCVSGGV